MRFNKSAFSTDVEIPTTELYVVRVITRVPVCPVHENLELDPCFIFESLISDEWITGICNVRARKAGMTAPIRPQSLNSSISGQSYHGPR